MKTMKYLIIATTLATTLGPVSVHAMNQEQKPQEAAAAAQAFTPEQVEQTNAQLIRAIRSGDTGDVTRALELGANVNLVDEYGHTPLKWAILSENAAIVRILIAHGAHVNQATKFGTPPLSWAILHQYSAEIVRILIENRANVNQANEDGFTPLLQAIAKRNIKMVQILSFHRATPSCEEPEAMKAFIQQAREARRQVGDYCLNLDDVDRLHFRTPTPLPVNLVADVYRFTHPLVGVKDPELRTLMKELIIKNRTERRAQERADEQEKRDNEENDFKPVGFYMSNLLKRHNLSEAQVQAVTDRLTLGSKNNGQLTAEAAHAIITNYLDELADNVAHQSAQERKDDTDAQA